MSDLISANLMFLKRFLPFFFYLFTNILSNYFDKYENNFITEEILIHTKKNKLNTE